MALYTTYDTVGIKEDVSDVISNLSPTKTPFQSMIGKDKTRNRTFSWLEDSLRAVQVNAKIEGFTAADATLTAPTLRSNTTQILEKTIKVSATEDAVDQYGRAKETAYQLAIAGEEIKRDLENAMVGIDQAMVVGDTVTARKFTSASNQIAAANTVAGGTAALTETMLLSAGQKAYTAGAEPTVFMIKPADSLIVAGFTGASGRSRTFNDGQKTVTNAVNLYVSPFGEYKVVLNRFIKTTNALLLDPDMWQQVTLRAWTREPLAKDGDASKTMLVGEFSLKHKNQLGSALINALT
jgi:hypothetical protein